MLQIKIFQKIKNYLVFVILATLVIYGIYLRTQSLLNTLDFYFDEMALLNNIFDRTILGFFSALNDSQCCPPMFLIFGKILYYFFGYNPKALRTATGFIPSILSIFAFIYLCFIIFKNKLSIIFSVFLFTIHYEIIRQAGMFKPYSTDLLITLIIVISILKLDKIKDKLLPKHSTCLLIFLFKLIFCSTLLFLLFLLHICFTKTNFYAD